MSVPEFPNHRQKVQRERREKQRKAFATEKFKLGVILVGGGLAWTISISFLAFQHFGNSWFAAKVAGVVLAIGLPPILFGMWLLWKPRAERRKAELIKRLAREGRLDEVQENTASGNEPTEDAAP